MWLLCERNNREKVRIITIYGPVKCKPKIIESKIAVVFNWKKLKLGRIYFVYVAWRS